VACCSNQLSGIRLLARKAGRKIVGRLDGKKLENAEDMNFFLALLVEFLVV
jgi:hypothetical protein